MTAPEKARKVVERLEALAKAATPGPWEVDGKRSDYDIRISTTDWEIAWVCADAGDVPEDDQTQSEANAALIPSSRNALPALLAVAKALLSVSVKLEDKHAYFCEATNLTCVCGKAEADSAISELAGLLE